MGPPGLETNFSACWLVVWSTSQNKFFTSQTQTIVTVKSMMFIAADVLNSAHFDSISFCEQFEINF